MELGARACGPTRTAHCSPGFRANSLGQMTPDHRMTDYYPLIARAIAGLETRESRLAAYDGVQAALLAQLHNLDPPLTDSEITRELLLLAEAIREVEAEAAGQPCAENPRQKPRSKGEPEDTSAGDSTAEMPAQIADPSRGSPPLTAEGPKSVRKIVE